MHKILHQDYVHIETTHATMPSDIYIIMYSVLYLGAMILGASRQGITLYHVNGRSTHRSENNSNVSTQMKSYE